MADNIEPPPETQDQDEQNTQEEAAPQENLTQDQDEQHTQEGTEPQENLTQDQIETDADDQGRKSANFDNESLGQSQGQTSASEGQSQGQTSIDETQSQGQTSRIEGQGQMSIDETQSQGQTSRTEGQSRVDDMISAPLDKAGVLSDNVMEALHTVVKETVDTDSYVAGDSASVDELSKSELDGDKKGTDMVDEDDIAAPDAHDQQIETEVTGDSEQVDPYATSPEPRAEATATVKFVMMPNGDVATMACSLNQSFDQLKHHFATELKMAANMIVIKYDGKALPDTMTLAQLGVGANGMVQLEMQSADPVNTPIRSYKPRSKFAYTMPDILTVRVNMGGNEVKEITIEVQRAIMKKPFLGGFRHKKTNIEYHNASTMTMRKQKSVPPYERFCRDTQTAVLKHKVLQTRNDMSTQMTKIGVFVSNQCDILVTPGKYTTADEHKAMLLSKVIIIQKYYRRWLASNKVKALRRMRAERLEWERIQELKKIKEKEDRIRDEFNRRMNPKTKADFDLLYAALERWRLEELRLIDENLTGAERKTALYMLMQQETELIAAIGRHHNEATDENNLKRIQEFLATSSSAKKWKSTYDGKPIEVDTPYTIRARELKDIYNSINMKYLTQDERLDVLLTLKHTVKEHDCKLTQEIIQLIDREADLLMRGVKEVNLVGLRKRIATLFLQYIKTPIFNPEAAPLLRVPQDPSQLRNNVRYCPSCNKYLASTDFQMTTTSNSSRVCKKCLKVNNDGQARHDYSHYRYMLKRLRKQEEKMGDNSRIAFLIQDSDMRYLVDTIWDSQSTLSLWDDMFDLVMVRWNRRDEWSPWNTILLTRDEAEAHSKLDEIEHGYEPVFIQKVHQKHVLARNYFSRLPGMAEHVREVLNQKHLIGGPEINGHNKSLSVIKA